MLFITVDTFHDVGDRVETTVSGDQLDWMKSVLQKYGPKADHIIVQGHAPVIGNPKATSSSKLMVKDGRNSDFWQLMKAAGVDAYLCGEFHALTTTKKDGIWQIVHGTSWGRKGHNQTYLVGHSTPNGLKLTMKSFPLEVKGEKTWNLDKPNGPREIVRIPEAVRNNGPKTVGSVIIKRNGNEKRQVNATGVFDQ